VSRFPAELTVTLTDGRTITECFNQAQMASFMREAMLEALRKGQSIIVFDGERIEVEPEHVASVHVVVRDAVTV
jgi:SpoVK/Ycf46/Vps4 family AAA+-type ATPase